MVQVRGYQIMDKELLASMGSGSGYVAVLVLAIYISSGVAEIHYTRHQLVWLLCPLLLYWISYVWLIAHRGGMHDDPLVFTVRDRVSRIVILLASGSSSCCNVGDVEEIRSTCLICRRKYCIFAKRILNSLHLFVDPFRVDFQEDAFPRQTESVFQWHENESLATSAPLREGIHLCSLVLIAILLSLHHRVSFCSGGRQEGSSAPSQPEAPLSPSS